MASNSNVNSIPTEGICGFGVNLNDPRSVKVSHFSYFKGIPRWPDYKMYLTYTFRSTARAPVDINVLRALISRAFSKWAAVTLFTFHEVPPNMVSDIEFGFHRLAHGDGAPFDGPGGVLAHSFVPTVGKCHFDADEQWSIDPNRDEIDIESVALHEIGHLLGLNHSIVPGAVMLPTIGRGMIKRNLHEDDIRGIRILYRLPV